MVFGRKKQKEVMSDEKGLKEKVALGDEDGY